MKLTIDNDKIGYVRLPNGVILQTVSGVINTIYTGVGGRITYYVPKNTSVVNVSESGLTGDIVYNGMSEIHVIAVPITKLTLNESTIVQSYSNSLLTVIEANKTVTLSASGCALTAKSIGDILYAAYADNRANVNFDFSGGTNAANGLIEDYWLYTYAAPTSVELADVLVSLTGNGGTIQLNP